MGRGEVEKGSGRRRGVGGVVARGDGTPVVRREGDEGVHEDGHGGGGRGDAHHGKQAFLPPPELADLSTQTGLFSLRTKYWVRLLEHTSVMLHTYCV